MPTCFVAATITTLQPPGTKAIGKRVFINENAVSLARPKHVHQDVEDRKYHTA